MSAERSGHDGQGVGADEDGRACAGCSLAVNRRSFLASTLVVAALLATGFPSESIAQVSLVDLVPIASNDESKTYAIPAADGASIDRSADVILVRWERTVYAFNLSCPHQNTALRWLESDHRFQCPKHKSKYKPDGAFIEGRATRGMDRFDIKREGANVVVNLDRMFKQDEDAAAWTAAAVHLD